MRDREEFEKWAGSVHLDTGKFSHSNRYYSCETNGALEGWQARQPEIDVLKAENEKLCEALEAHMKKELAAAPTPPVQSHQLDDAYIRAIALDCGFKLKTQPDGTEDLNPYVYRFAREILSTVPRAQDTHPQSDKLRKAAEEVVSEFELNKISSPLPYWAVRTIHKLRAALEGK